MNLGKKIRQMRNQKGLTQEELADRCELTKGYISQLENDLNSPSIATLTDILAGKLLGCKTILVGSINPNENLPTRFVRALERSTIRK